MIREVLSATEMVFAVRVLALTKDVEVFAERLVGQFRGDRPFADRGDSDRWTFAHEFHDLRHAVADAQSEVVAHYGLVQMFDMIQVLLSADGRHG